MELVKCHKCNTEINNNVDICPNCGYKINSNKSKVRTKDNILLRIIRNPYKSLLLSFVLLFMLGIIFSGITEEGTFFYTLTEFIRISLIIFFIVSILRIIISFFKSTNSENKYIEKKYSFYNIDLYKVCLVLLPIFFIAITIIYHDSGPRGAVNNMFSKNELVSCKKQNSDNYNVYYCKRRGESFVVGCSNSDCSVERLRRTGD